MTQPGSPQLREERVGPAETPDRPEVLYLIGAARSGTTFLEALLDSHRRIAAVGELRYLMDPEEADPRICSCGSQPDGCAFWSGVLRRWRETLPAGAMASFVAHKRTYERLYGLPRLLIDVLVRRSRFSAYCRATRSLLEAIRSQADVGIIADSSKTPARAMLLSLGRAADVHLVHLLRDPRAVVWSQVRAEERRRRRPAGARYVLFVARRVAQWVAVNATAEALTRGGRKGLRLRYEDLVSDPEQALRRVGRLVGLDLAPIGRRALAGEAFSYAHLVGGNRRRFAGPARLELDVAWVAEAPRWLQRLVWLIAWPMARAYGYRSTYLLSEIAKRREAGAAAGDATED